VFHFVRHLDAALVDRGRVVNQSVDADRVAAGVDALTLLRVAMHDAQLSQSTTLKGKGSPYSTTERRVPELIPVLGSQPAGDVSHKPDGRLPLLPSGLQLPPQPLRGLLPVLLLGEQRHDGCEQFA